MALSYPLTMPTNRGWVSKRLELVHNRNVFRSEVTQTEQVVLRAGSFWSFFGELPLMNAAQARPWMAFLQGLRGGAGTFWLPVPDYDGPQNGAAGNGAVNGAGQSGLELDGDGFATSETPLLEAGEFIQCENQCYQLTADADTDGGGLTTFDLVPEIRVAPADGATIEVAAPKILMRADFDATGWDTDHRNLYKIKLAAFEVVA